MLHTTTHIQYQQGKFPACTLKNKPRLPEHCIAYVLEEDWGNTHPDTPFDGDIKEHVIWVMEKSMERGAKFGISGFTFALVQGVVKNIIPAIVSTNATISAACTNEAIKVLTLFARNLDDYETFVLLEGVYTNKQRFERCVMHQILSVNVCVSCSR